MDRVVVVGASVAGITAVETLRRRGFAGSISLVGQELHLPYDRPPLSKQVLTGQWDADRAIIRGRSDLEQLGLDLRLGVRANSLFLDSRQIELSDGERLGFDGLILATGVTPRQLPNGHELSGVHVLRTIEDALALRAQFVRGRRLVVVGAGFLGCEVAAAATQAGLHVSLVDPLPAPMMRQLGAEMGSLAATLHRDHGVEVLCHTGIDRLVGDNAVTGVELSTGTVLPADLVLVSIGAVPVTDWLVGSGLTLDDGIVCNDKCEAAPGVYAAGDVARWWHNGLNAHVRVEHRTNATEQAIAAAENLLGSDRSFAPVPYFWTNQYDTRIQAYGTFPTGSRPTIVTGSTEEGRFIAHYVSDDRITGVLSWNMPKQIHVEREVVGNRAQIPAV
ncbi:NAD(P)H-nitrite reductase [Nocardioides sp. J9]|nr:NAD(P)H-nitrite reductase [Nocardioides sp. J9]